MAREELPPELKVGPKSWRKAFNKLREYAVATSLQGVNVTVTLPDGSEVPARVDIQPSADGVTIRLQLSSSTSPPGVSA